MLEIFKIIVPSLVPCFITLYFTNKINIRSLEQQHKEHKESLERAEEKYQEQLENNKETERLNHLPYLSLIPKYQIHRFEGEMKRENNDNIFIPFKIINQGAGIAFSVHVKILEEDSKPNTIQYNYNITAFQRNHKDGYDILEVSEPIDTDVLRVDNHSEFCLYLTAIDGNNQEISPLEAIEWEFDVTFYDIQGKHYKQRYSFYTSIKNNKIYRVNSYMPEIVE
ncbi:hypothetical protein RGT17_03630 [Bacillus altitudinis]|uniref:hypothetical protein n=1 Tax=Bacillus pumilus TaxID=1408 RepID=UPI0025A25B43|nr:hypothetical protein [Bacillus pumilus]MDM5319026.1 hypothetical protein [Bacillus pumilus]MDR4994333.1 hypothetical protein [Bacillus altitudinis]